MNAITRSISAFLASSIGRKMIVALTGLMLAGFLAGHLGGNLLMYVGADAFNGYAKKLHDMKPLVWAFRIGLLVAVALHIYYTIKLTQENRAARQKYSYPADASQTSSRSSRLMILSGLTILAFVVYHLLHFTVRWGNEYDNPAYYSYMLNGEQVHHAYQMVIDGFSWLPATIFYLIAMALLCSHLSHGVASVFQTLGLSTVKTRPMWETISKLYAWGIFIGFASIPVAVLTGIIK